MELIALPAFTDNYIWLLHNGRQAFVVDPGQAAPVTEALQARGLQLQGILVTHHHGDHVGGLSELTEFLSPGARIWGPAHEKMPVPIHPLVGGDHFELLGHRIEVVDVPGHTAGHIAFFLPGAGGSDATAGPVLFCGDTLFSAGCGRLFEGTAAQMQASLSRLAALPASTRVCCAHEYTLSNLRFARTVEPENEAITQHEAWCQAVRAEHRPTLPSTLSLELQINPFLRCHHASVRQAAQHFDPRVGPEPASVLAALRQWKNEFR
ncbi:hydroxyacylglutathione hydrolase [Roseateles sp. SL47]|uniref:hydroxyacylglutathione hydrolase n=1 Tax=Roseateles sp. SL47 TaxID=2995138 RepID=UPI0022712DE7|nr:hydroxyacylglutathione hydrolase [Roseateles sp. SL47]WAC75267.1 hydroxyacylglutathione hydrolase [Roseateles sp. SL47]